jgi:hypothetical protein
LSVFCAFYPYFVLLNELKFKKVWFIVLIFAHLNYPDLDSLFVSLNREAVD